MMGPANFAKRRSNPRIPTISPCMSVCLAWWVDGKQTYSETLGSLILFSLISLSCILNSPITCEYYFISTLHLQCFIIKNLIKIKYAYHFIPYQQIILPILTGGLHINHDKYWLMKVSQSAIIILYWL